MDKSADRHNQLARWVEDVLVGDPAGTVSWSDAEEEAELATPRRIVKNPPPPTDPTDDITSALEALILSSLRPQFDGVFREQYPEAETLGIKLEVRLVTK